MVIKFILSVFGLNKNNKIENGTVGFFSIYPLWWDEVDNNTVQERYFNGIPHLINESRPVKILLFLNGLKILRYFKIDSVLL